MSAGKHNFVLEQGSDFIQTVQFLDVPPDPINDPDTPGAPIDITGWDARMDIREGPRTTDTLILGFSITGGEISIVSPATLGTFLIAETAAVTAALTEVQFADGAFYDFEAIDTPGVLGVAGAVYRLLQGKIQFKINVTLP